MRDPEAEPTLASAAHATAQSGIDVLIADEARPFREVLLRAVQELGLTCEQVEDGESALTYTQEKRPRLLLVNVYLRKVLGIIVCERVKADPRLSGTKVVLIGSLFRKDRFVRGPDHLYGADDYIEEAITPEQLRQRLAELLGGASEVASLQTPAPSSEVPGAAAPASAQGSIAIPEDLQRLIRIMLSDIELYNPDRFQTAIQNGQFTQEFKIELEEGRRMVLERFPDLPQAEESYRAGVESWLEERRGAPVS